ncbi:hypothetical protein [Nonomuraea sp. NPDC049480]|uniref:hypothetical protein n=1 Tax=Nonomuraea sp. NPDC049480 TaxID=3364353 RepID=UPI0037B02249
MTTAVLLVLAVHRLPKGSPGTVAVLVGGAAGTPFARVMMGHAFLPARTGQEGVSGHCSSSCGSS